MIEAYFEEEMPVINGIRYPFHIFICNSMKNNFVVNHHWHHYIELLFFLEGTAKVTLGGKDFNVSTGDFIIVNSREVHSIYSQSGTSTRYIVIKFDMDILYTASRATFETRYIIPFTLSQYKHQSVYKNKELKASPVSFLINQIYDEYTTKKYAYEFAVRMDISSLFLWIIRDWENKGAKLELQNIPNEIGIQKLQLLLDFLDIHFAENISVRDMAKMCNVSYCYFSRFFKKVMSKTFTEYLNYIRIIEAEKLLLTTEMNITEIAAETGFSNTSYFIEQFKRYKSISPKQYKIKNMVING